MKPLKLVISAFGPYLDRTVIDFSDLGSSGLYLVTGDTGAGKSTIFEAICYALYVETVSGSDRNAQMLRNNSASDEIETFIELDFTANGKNYHVFRSPKYELNKLKRTRKKTGNELSDISEKHSEHGNKFELRCLDEGITYSKENDGAEKIKEIMGIGKDNFKKISMIAQGEFMSVIREKTDGREKILNSVFNTQNYGKLTEKLKEYKNTAKSETDTLSAEINSAVTLISCDSSSQYSAQLEQIQRTGFLSAEETDTITSLLNNLIDEDRSRESEIKKQLKENRQKNEQNEGCLTKAAMRQKYEKELSEKKAAEALCEKKLPEIEIKCQSMKDNSAKADQLKAQAEIIRSKLSDYDKSDAVSAAIQQLVKEKINTEKVLQKKKLKKEQTDRLIKENTETLLSLENIEEQKAQADKEYDAIVEKGTRLRTLQNKYRKLDVLKINYEKEKNSYADASLNYQNARTSYEHLNRAFLDDQAGILAQTLQPDCPCPVCGSVDHPSPANTSAKAPTKTQVSTAKKKADDLSEQMHQTAQSAAAAKTAAQTAADEIIEKIKEVFGADISYKELPDFCSRTEQHMQKAETIVKTLNQKRSEIKRKLELKSDLRNDTERLRKESEKYASDITELTAVLAAKTEQIKANKSTLTELTESLRFRSRTDAVKQIDQLNSDAKSLTDAYEAAKKELNDLKNNISMTKSAEEVLNKQISEIEHNDITALTEMKKQLKEADQKLTAEGEIIATRKSNNLTSLSVLTEKGSRYAKAVEHFRRCEDLYNTASGNLTNREKIKLDSYILSAYFDRVVLRANNRMALMTDGRYSLVRSDKSADKRKNAGLDLNIIDNENGRERSVNTLSGGESFMAALALSLGLSDEIQSESGGIRLETMFIDEGFGSLDDKALDKAVEALTELGSGDCLIGIISHVGRLKEMINKRIVITRDNLNNTVAKVEI